MIERKLAAFISLPLLLIVPPAFGASAPQSTGQPAAAPAELTARSSGAPQPRTISDITAVLDHYKPDPKLAEQNRAKANAEPPPGLAGRELGRFLHARAWAAQAIGESKREIADLRKALELLDSADPNQPQLQQDLSNALLGAGHLPEAVRLREQLASRVQSGRLLSLTATLAAIYRNLGDQDAVRGALQRAEAGNSQMASARSPLGIALQREREYFISGARASALEVDGKYDQAEVAYQRAVREAQANLEQAERRISSRLIPDGHTPESHREIAANHVDTAELALSRFLIARNRLEEAELALRNVLQRSLARLGRDNVRTARVLALFAEALRSQGRYHEALQVAQAAVSSYVQAGAVPAAGGLARARRGVAAVLVSQSRWKDAIVAYDEMRAGLATDPESLEAFGKGDARWGLALVKTGRHADAFALLAARVDHDRKTLGDSHPAVAATRGVLALALARGGEKQRALEEFRAATAVLLDPAARAERSATHEHMLRHILEGYIDLLIEIRGTDLERSLSVDAGELAFPLADLIRGQGVQRALSASAARAAAGDPAIADLVRAEQDLDQHTRALYGYLLNQVSLPPADQSPKIIGDMRKRLEQIAGERKKLQAEVQRRFPRYADFVNPRPPTLQAARAALRGGEVLLSVLITEDRTYVWAVPKEGPLAFHAAALSEAEINRVVTHLRRSLDSGEATIDQLPAFDVAEAAKLYEALLKPVESAWQGAHTLMVVTNGALAQLPFGTLPTAAVTAAAEQGLQFERYKNVPWLIRQIAVTQMPAANTLVTLRALPVGNAARATFAGFGDPQFGAKTILASPQVAMGKRNLEIKRVTESTLSKESAPVDYMPYGELPPLPDTREEILSIARALKADVDKDVFLGLAASKQNVKSADLSKRRIIAFATHGLIPGDFPDLDQPALALAAPDGKAETGLLTLQDVLSLKLDADWVVLSACNTAAGDGAGAEAISGLGRGFFYAGTRALLVTHWPVETRSARLLVTKLFELYTTETGTARAEALRRASLAVIDDTAADPATGKPMYSYAHPLFWAPYALVGDGGR